MSLAKFRRQDGAAAVEFALVLPVFLTIMFGIFEFGRLFSWHTAITTASREAARYGMAIGDSANGIPQYTDCDEIRAAGKNLSVMLPLEDADFTIAFDDGPGTSVHTTCSGSSISASNITTGDRILVTVTHDFDSTLPFIGDMLGPLTLTSTDTRTIATELVPATP